MTYYAASARRPFAVAAGSGHGGGTAGVSSPGLDRLSLQFVIWAQAARSKSLDIGCGDGVAALALLARGGHVVTVDPDVATLHRLVASVSLEQCRRLQVRLGKIPQIDFKLANFAAIHASRVLHRLELEDARLSLRKFSRWLYPKGKLFVSTLTPQGAAGRLQPGHGSPMDELTLRREVAEVGMIVEQSFTYVPPWSGAECCAVIAQCPT